MAKKEIFGELATDHTHRAMLLNIKLRERFFDTKLQPTLVHDKEKKRLIKPTNNAYLHALKITDADGNVFKNAQDKYKQINQYIEILSSLIKELPEGTIKNV